jgi:hypothetical protein
MLSHITSLADGLIWTRTGVVWAVWRVSSPLAYDFQPDDKKELARAHHTALYRTLPGESLHLGLVAATDPAAIVEQMIEGIDLENRPAWAAECEATLDFLEEIEIGRRAYWIAAPLPNPGSKRFLEPARASWNDLQDRIGFPRTIPAARNIDERIEQAATLAAELPDALGIRPAPVAEIAWIFAHTAKRGLGLDTAVPVQGSVDEQLRLTAPSLLAPIVLDPNGRTDFDKLPSPLTVMQRPFVKVIDPTDPERASYQSTLVVAKTPRGGVAFPDGEWIGRLDDSGVTADWAVRMTTRSREEVTRRNRRAVNTLNDQYDQREGETRAGSSLDMAAQEVIEYQQVMDSDDLEVEVDATTMFTVASPDPTEALAAARALKKHFAAMQFTVRADPTMQADLFMATLPGTTTRRKIREYAQIAPARDFAAAVPFVTTELGDRKGCMFAIEVGGTRVNPVLIDLFAATEVKNVSLAVGFNGELGAGKSVGMKTLSMDHVDRGATLMAVDHTEMGEWGIAVSEIDGHQVVEISEKATRSIDPLRILPPEIAPRIARSFLTVLLSTPTKSQQNILLGKVLKASYMAEHNITSLGALARHLETDCDLDGARQLADEMRVFSELDFGRAVFDASGVDTHYIVGEPVDYLPRADLAQIEHALSRYLGLDT